MKYSEKLFNRYLDEIRNWSWDSVLQEIEDNVEETFDGQLEGRSFLGSVFRLAPSGKYYTFWTTNQTVKDQIKDQAFYEALDQVALEHDCYITSGEGDPCDLFAGKTIEPEEDEEESIDCNP